jgi:bacterioferritin-associated ferredoxin
MYICICNGVTECEIRGAADLGCHTVEDLRRDLGVGDCCGKCVPEARNVLRKCAHAHPPAQVRDARPQPSTGGDD